MDHENKPRSFWVSVWESLPGYLPTLLFGISLIALVCMGHQLQNPVANLLLTLAGIAVFGSLARIFRGAPWYVQFVLWILWALSSVEAAYFLYVVVTGDTPFG